MAHTLKLLYGHDKRNPDRELDLANTADDGIYLTLGGFSPGPGTKEVIWSGRSSRFDGQSRISSSRDNAQFTLTLDLVGSSTAELAYLAREINRFINEVTLYEEERVGAPVWLEYRWQDGLNGLSSRPTFGQLSHYYRVLDLEVAGWPEGLHQKTLITGNILNIDLDFTCSPYAEGLEQKLGAADGLPDVDADVTLAYNQPRLSQGYMSTDRSITTWITHRESDYYAWEFYVSADNYMRLFWDESDSRFELVKRISASTETTNGDSQSLSAGDEVQLVVVDDSTGSVTLYVNGTAQANTGSGGGTLSFGGTLYLGSAKGSASGVTANTAGLDGFRIFSEVLTSAQVSDFYTAENAIKADGNIIGRPPFLKTTGGAGNFDNVDGALSASAKDNWGVAGWISGDVPALTRWEIDPDTGDTERVFWLGRKATKAEYTPDATHWLEYSGTTDTGNSSGDAYETDTSSGGGSDTHDFDTTLNENQYTRGRYQVLGRFKVTGASASVQPYIKFGLSDRILYDAVTIATNANFLFRDFGEIFIDWPRTIWDAGDNMSIPRTMVAGLLCTETEATATTWQLDFLQLLPYPSCRVENENASPSYASGDTLIIDERTAYIVDSSDADSQLNFCEFQGVDVTLVPQYYNYVFLIQGEEGQQYTVGTSATVFARVTPRWLLAGGLV